MTHPTNAPRTVAHTTASLTIQNASQLHAELHKITALAAGAEALAHRGIDEGAIEDAQLENLGLLLIRLREDLQATMAAIHDAATGTHHE